MPRESTRNAAQNGCETTSSALQDLVTSMQELDSLPFDQALKTLRTLQSTMPASGKLIADFNPAPAAGEKLTSFLRERVFSKNS